MNKKQEEQYNKYYSLLKIKSKGEDFVLKHILQRDWNRNILLQNIEVIKQQHGLIQVKCSTINGSYSFSVCDIESKGWKNPEMSLSEKEVYIGGDLYHKMD